MWGSHYAQALLGGGCPATLEDNSVASCNLNAFVPYNLYVLASAASLGKKRTHSQKHPYWGGGVYCNCKQTETEVGTLSPTHQGPK